MNLVKMLIIFYKATSAIIMSVKCFVCLIFFLLSMRFTLKKKKKVVNNVIRTPSTELLMLSCLHILKAYLLTRGLT